MISKKVYCKKCKSEILLVKTKKGFFVACENKLYNCPKDIPLGTMIINLLGEKKNAIENDIGFLKHKCKTK